MRDYCLKDLHDDVLLTGFKTLVQQDRLTTADLLAHIAEVDARHLYAAAGYSSMRDYCVALGMSEDAASRRIQAARAARRFPLLFTALAEGRLHLTGVGLLAPHLTEETLPELVAAASNRSKAEIEVLLARYSGRRMAEASGSVRVVPGECATQHALAHVTRADSAQADLDMREHAGGGEPGEVDTFSEVPERYLLRVTLDRATYERLRHAQELLSHAVPSGNVAQVFDRALVALIGQLERRKCGHGTRSNARRHVARSRSIPPSIKKAVWDRDGGQCTFVGVDGHRCGSKKFLEIDHVEPFARNAEATANGLRLRCRTHNQYEAERVFGSEFMRRKREEARRIAEQKRRETAEARAKAQAASAEVEEQIQDVLSALRGLGIKGEQARLAADHARMLPQGTLVDRIRAALQFHGDAISRSPRMERARRASSG